MTLRAVVEVPRGGFVKREMHAGGGVDFRSPLPCPFNYGFLPGVPGADGDPEDAVILGPRLPPGAAVELPQVAVVRFLDGGVRDDKRVLSARPLRRRDRWLLAGFFRAYALARGLRDRARGRPPPRYEGLEVPGAPPVSGAAGA